jgi:hypothetical protein
MRTITNRLVSKCVCLIAVPALAIIIGGLSCVLAQYSVERIETAQAARQPVDSSIRAREAVQKPGEKQTPAETGHLAGAYAWSSSMEIGYRFVESGGSRDKFLSDLYLKDGVRLLDFQMDARSIAERGGLFDFLRADVINGGGDSSQYYYVRMDKTRAYRFDATVRQFKFYRFLPEFALNQHNLNLDRQASDFNLKLFPQRAIRVNLGYSRSTSNGPFFTTYDYERDEFPVEGESRWESNEYRLGVDATYHRWDFFLGADYRYFKNDTEYFQDEGAVNRGNNPAANSSSLSFFDRNDPTRSKGGVVTGSVRGDITNRFHLVAIGSHTDEWLEVNQFEQTAGSAATPTTRIFFNNIFTNGNVKRPSATADLGLTYDLTDHLSLNNSFRYYAFRILGDVNSLTQSNRQAASGAIANTSVRAFDDQLTDYASYWNTLQLQFNYGRKFSASGGWRATHRDVTLVHSEADRESDTQNTNTFSGGLRIRPLKSTSLFLDYEKGETDNAFVRITPLEYQRFRVRANIQANNTLSFNTAFTITDTTNPTTQVENDGNFRSFSVSAAWEPKDRLWLTGGYNYDYLFNTADILFFLNNIQNTGRSVYYSRQNVVFLDSRIGVTNRIDLFLVYRYIQDLGAPSSPNVPQGANNFITSYPLIRHNPEARIAFRINNHLTGNLSYRHYSYNEKTFSVQDYRAQIVTTSLRFTF